MTALRDRFRGCLLGGAVGDALGAGIEFMSLAEIGDRFGPAGVTGYVPAYGQAAAITDDTQMTLFTAEALIRARCLPGGTGQADVPALWRAYQRWRLTQAGHGHAAARARSHETDGWLLTQDFLWHQRSPGTTCVSALSLGQPGSMTAPVNDSKGCGGVMRVAPIGLAAADPFTLGCQAAALTHGHPAGYLAAGAFAVMISELARGASLPGAAAAGITRLQAAEHSADVTRALTNAVHAADTEPPLPQTLARLGEGWIAEEALAIATYCALAATDFRSGVLLAVNHGGDSDSTGAICGNLLGTHLGARGIDVGLLKGLEGRNVIEQIADDLHEVATSNRRPPAERYPPG
jgi:ADP-ribosyl-[dinitrogen reductase] hydrolase